MAAKLGKYNVDQMLRQLTAKQLLGWNYYASIEPFEELRADFRAASIAATIANVNRGKDHPGYKIEDFLIKFDEAVVPAPRRRQTPEEQLAIVRMIAASYSASDRPL